MTKRLLLIGLFVFLIIVLIYSQKMTEKVTPAPQPDQVTPTAMQITSPTFRNNEKIPSKYTCDAENISPELVFSDIPENARSLTLISHDPDAPVQGGWTHWVVINMDPTTTGIAENSKPVSGLETATSFGRPGYGGPCPPSGSHRYYFYLYALDTTLGLNASAAKEDVEAAMEGHVIGKAELMGLYERQ